MYLSFWLKNVWIALLTRRNHEPFLWIWFVVLALFVTTWYLVIPTVLLHVEVESWSFACKTHIFRKPQYKDVYRRTIEMPQRASLLKVNCYRPRSVASEGYISTGVCHFNSRGGGGGHQHQWSTTSPPPGPGQNVYPLPPPDQVRMSTPSPPTTRRRAVRILLECILVV